MMHFSTLEYGLRTEKTVADVSFEMFCDILVIGLGTAGAYAALAAAREGASVIAVEKDENIGGMPINGRVTSYYYGARGGTFESVDCEAKARGDLFAAGACHQDVRQTLLTERLDAASVVRMCATVVGVYFDGNRAVGIRVFDNGEYKNIHSKMIIDATSDGHIIRMCPVKVELGRPLDGKTVPFTVRSESVCEDGKYRYDNADSGYCDQYRAEEYSKKILTAHAAKTAVTRSEKRLVAVAPVCGLREGIRFEGEETLCYSDIILEKMPDRVLLYAYSDLDKHGHDLALDEELYQNWWCISNLSTVTVSIPVPMGTVVPRGLLGIVSACRCLSVDSYASSAVRMIRDMYRLGECVGIACAQAVADRCDFMKTDYGKYMERAEHFGCFSGEREKKFGFHAPGVDKPYTPVDFQMGMDEILSRLSTDRPGPAIWSCFRYGDESVAARLSEALASEDGMLSGNAAIALGIMGRRTCLPKLREIVRARDCFYFLDCRRSNQFRSAVAICLLGRLGDASDMELLREIVMEDGEFEKPIYHTLEPNYLFSSLKDCNYVLFQHFTHAAMALLKIAERQGIDLAETFESRFTGASRANILRAMTSQPATSAFYGEVEDFMDYVMRRARRS